MNMIMFIGFSSLAVLAVVSVVILKPITLNFSKKGNPEALWKGQDFRRINGIITLCWGGIFLIDGLFFLFLDSFMVPVILVLASIPCAILFSRFFPQKYASHLA